jgi:hypothetical protein
MSAKLGKFGVIAALVLVMTTIVSVQAETVKFSMGGYNFTFQANESVILGRQYSQDLTGEVPGRGYVQEMGGNVSFNGVENVGPMAAFYIFRYNSSTRIENYRESAEMVMDKQDTREVARMNVSQTSIAGMTGVLGKGKIVKYGNMPMRVYVFPMPEAQNDFCEIVVYQNTALAGDIGRSLEIE